MKTENLNNLPIELHREVFNHTRRFVVNVIHDINFLNVAVFWVAKREGAAVAEV